MNKNVSKIAGNHNLVQQGENNIQQVDSKLTKEKSKSFYERAGFWVAAATLIVAIIVGWDEIMKIIGK